MNIAMYFVLLWGEWWILKIGNSPGWKGHISRRQGISQNLLGDTQRQGWKMLSLPDLQSDVFMKLSFILSKIQLSEECLLVFSDNIFPPSHDAVSWQPICNYENETYISRSNRQSEADSLDRPLSRDVSYFFVFSFKNHTYNLCVLRHNGITLMPRRDLGHTFWYVDDVPSEDI